ncbi:MAG: hypothetical protein RQ745_04400 [Longimicrobiales bacterium]|nr:hypothetical protein [Longimicrobiales bacterium]
MRSAYADYVLDVYPESRQAAFIDALDHPLVPEVTPAYSRVVTDALGYTWAQHFTPDPREFGEWDIFSPAGEFVGSVPNPSGLWVQAITADAVVGVGFDELGVSYLQRHRLERPE